MLKLSVKIRTTTILWGDAKQIGEKGEQQEERGQAICLKLTFCAVDVVVIIIINKIVSAQPLARIQPPTKMTRTTTDTATTTIAMHLEKYLANKAAAAAAATKNEPNNVRFHVGCVRT